MCKSYYMIMSSNGLPVYDWVSAVKEDGGLTTFTTEGDERICVGFYGSKDRAIKRVKNLQSYDNKIKYNLVRVTFKNTGGI